MENLLNINNTVIANNLIRRNGRSANKYSTKIINKRKKLVPLFTIGQDYNNLCINENARNFLYAHAPVMTAALKEKKWDFIINNYSKESSLYSEAFDIILSNAFSNFKDALSPGENNYISYRRSNIDANKLKNLSKKDADTLLLYFLHKEKEKVEKYITSGISIDSALEGIVGYNASLKYTSFISDFYNANGFVQYRTRTQGLGYIVGRYYIAEYNEATGATTPLVCGVIEKKDIPYFKAAQVLNDPISTDYLQLWVKEGFDHKDTLYRGLRPKYRKLIKKPLELAGVDIIERTTLNDLFCVYTPPKVNNIKEYEQFLKKSSEEAINQLKQNNLLN